MIRPLDEAILTLTKMLSQEITYQKWVEENGHVPETLRYSYQESMRHARKLQHAIDTLTTISETT